MSSFMLANLHEASMDPFWETGVCKSLCVKFLEGLFIKVGFEIFKSQRKIEHGVICDDKNKGDVSKMAVGRRQGLPSIARRTELAVTPRNARAREKRVVFI